MVKEKLSCLIFKNTSYISSQQMGNSTFVDPYLLLQELAPMISKNGTLMKEEVPKIIQ